MSPNRAADPVDDSIERRDPDRELVCDHNIDRIGIPFRKTPTRPSGLEHNVQITVSRRQVDHQGHRCEKPRIERRINWTISRPQPGTEFGERPGKTLKVGVVASRHHIDIRRGQRRAVDHRRKPTNDYITNSVLVQHSTNDAGVEPHR